MSREDILKNVYRLGIATPALLAALWLGQDYLAPSNLGYQSFASFPPNRITRDRRISPDLAEDSPLFVTDLPKFREWYLSAKISPQLATEVSRAGIDQKTGEVHLAPEVIENIVLAVESQNYKDSNPNSPHLVFHLLSSIIRETSGGRSWGTGRYPDDMEPNNRDAFVAMVDRFNALPDDQNPLIIHGFGTTSPVPYNVIPVSARPGLNSDGTSNGWGGAMGDYQFMARTFEAHKPYELADPWDSGDSTWAAAHKLIIDGIDSNPCEAYRRYYGNYDECDIRVRLAQALEQSYINFMQTQESK